MFKSLLISIPIVCVFVVVLFGIRQNTPVPRPNSLQDARCQEDVLIIDGMKYQFFFDRDLRSICVINVTKDQLEVELLRKRLAEFEAESDHLKPPVRR